MNYTAPLTDMRFLLEQVTGLDTISQLPGCEDATADTVAAVLEEAGVAPVCRLDPSRMLDRTPVLFRPCRDFAGVGGYAVAI